MKKTKFFAVVMAAVMTLSMAACGEQTSNEASTAPTTEQQNVAIEGASINFEDGNMGFVAPFMEHATSAEIELSVADFNGSKALKVVNLDGKTPWIGLDLTSLLGANAAKVAGVEMVVATSYGDGKFYSSAGEIKIWHGTKFKESDSLKIADWSVYMEKKNPKIATAKISAGNEFVAEESNLMLINLKEDNGIAKGVNATIYIDDIRFYDASGNTVTADTTVAFNAPNGFAGGGPDLSNLYALSNAKEFPGFACKGDGWGQNGFDIPEDIMNALVPGSVVEISYTSEDGTMWIVMPDSAAGWMRVAQDQAFINNSCSVAQIPYEKFVEVLGEDKTTWGARMQCEAKTPWEVFSVKVGTATPRVGIKDAVEFPNFACKGDGWGQNGFDIPEDIMNALVPGSVIEISYTSEDGTMWIVMPDAAAGWSRCAQDTAVCNGSTAYITYEQIVAVCGEDKSTWGARMQCEAKTPWEVFSVRVGTKVDNYPVINALMAFDGYACKGDGWGQNGADMTPELLAALVPGSVVEISFTSDDNTMWIVMPDAAAGWSRCAQDTAFIDNGKAYVTYEQIAAVCGEDKSTWGARMQFEAKTPWEVFGIRVGKMVATASDEVTEAPKLENPLLQTADGTVVYTASKTWSDTTWWTQLSMPKEEIIGAIGPDEITAIKFTANTNFVLGYKDVNGNWVQTENVEGPYVIKSMELGDAWDMALALSKGDGAEYTVTWEVYTGGDKTVYYEEAVKEEAPALPDPVVTVEDGKGSIVAADANWWTQIALTKEQLFAGVAEEKVTGIKFSSDTTFVVGYNGPKPADNPEADTWTKLENATSYEVNVADVEWTDGLYYLCVALSKGDSVEYTINWEVVELEIPAVSNVTVGEGAGTITYSGALEIPLTREQLLAGVAAEEVAGIRFTTDTGFGLRFYYPDDGTGRYPWKECGITSSYDIPVKYISLAEDHFDFTVSRYAEDAAEHTITWQILREGEIEAEPAEVDVTTVTQEEAKAMYTGDYSIPYSFNTTDIALNSNPMGEFYGNNTIYFDFIGLEGYDSWQVAAVAVYENGEYEVIDIYTSIFSGAYGETNEAGFMDVKGSESTYMRLQYDASVFETEGVERVGIMVYGMVPVNVESYR